MACLLAASLSRKGREEECGIPSGNGARYLVKLIRKRLVQGCARRKSQVYSLQASCTPSRALLRYVFEVEKKLTQTHAQATSHGGYKQASKMRAHRSSFVEVIHVGNREKQPKSVILLGDVTEACFSMNSQHRLQACHMPDTLAPHVFLSTKKYFENRGWQMCGRQNFRPIEGVEDALEDKF